VVYRAARHQGGTAGGEDHACLLALAIALSSGISPGRRPLDVHRATSVALRVNELQQVGGRRDVKYAVAEELAQKSPCEARLAAAEVAAEKNDIASLNHMREPGTECLRRIGVGQHDGQHRAREGNCVWR